VPEGLSILPDKSVDTVVMLDLIEHISKRGGRKLLAEAERLARLQVALFTPLGFMDQAYEKGERDAWGFPNTELQTHKSGWIPEDFDETWHTFVCPTYHKHPKTGAPFGAFYALKTFPEKVTDSFAKKTLIASSYATPAGGWQQRVAMDADLEDVLWKTFESLAPRSFSFLTDYNYDPYNEMIYFHHVDYAVRRHPTKYDYLPDLFAVDFPGMAGLAAGSIQRIEDGGDHLKKCAETLYQRVIKPNGIEKIIYIDKPTLAAYALLYIQETHHLPVRFVNVGGMLDKAPLLKKAAKDNGAEIADVKSSDMKSLLRSL
jgi:hypothetical protein